MKKNYGEDKKKTPILKQLIWKKKKKENEILLSLFDDELQIKEASGAWV